MNIFFSFFMVKKRFQIIAGLFNLQVMNHASDDEPDLIVRLLIFELILDRPQPLIFTALDYCLDGCKRLPSNP